LSSVDVEDLADDERGVLQVEDTVDDVADGAHTNYRVQAANSSWTLARASGFG
jgi:hypothetical protein